MPPLSDSEIRMRLRSYRQFLGQRRHIQDILAESPCAQSAGFAKARVHSYDQMLHKLVELFPDLR